MILTYYSLFLGKNILRSFKFDDIETWNQQQQQKRTVGYFCIHFKLICLWNWRSHCYFGIF